jgi:hypothetical protein
MFAFDRVGMNVFAAVRTIAAVGWLFCPNNGAAVLALDGFGLDVFPAIRALPGIV